MNKIKQRIKRLEEYHAKMKSRHPESDLKELEERIAWLRYGAGLELEGGE